MKNSQLPPVIDRCDVRADEMYQRLEQECGQTAEYANYQRNEDDECLLLDMFLTPGEKLHEEVVGASVVTHVAVSRGIAGAFIGRRVGHGRMILMTPPSEILITDEGRAPLSDC